MSYWFYTISCFYISTISYRQAQLKGVCGFLNVYNFPFSCNVSLFRSSTILFDRYKSANCHHIICILLWKSATLPLLLTITRPKYLARHRPTAELYTPKEIESLNVKLKSIGDPLEYYYRSNCLKVTRKIAKFQTVDLENNGQGHLELDEVRWSNTPHWFANVFQNYVSKFYQFEEIAKWKNFDCLFLKIRDIDDIASLVNVFKVCRKWSGRLFLMHFVMDRRTDIHLYCAMTYAVQGRCKKWNVHYVLSYQLHEYRNLIGYVKLNVDNVQHTFIKFLILLRLFSNLNRIIKRFKQTRLQSPKMPCKFCKIIRRVTSPMDHKSERLQVRRVRSSKSHKSEHSM